VSLETLINEVCSVPSADLRGLAHISSPLSTPLKFSLLSQTTQKQSLQSSFIG
jgi:hypothetical protein